MPVNAAIINESASVLLNSSRNEHARKAGDLGDAPAGEAGPALTPGVCLGQRPPTAGTMETSHCRHNAWYRPVLSCPFLSLPSQKSGRPLGAEVNLRISAFQGLPRRCPNICVCTLSLLGFTKQHLSTATQKPEGLLIFPSLLPQGPASQYPSATEA